MKRRCWILGFSDMDPALLGSELHHKTAEQCLGGLRSSGHSHHRPTSGAGSSWVSKCGAASLVLGFMGQGVLIQCDLAKVLPETQGWRLAKLKGRAALPSWGGDAAT